MVDFQEKRWHCIPLVHHVNMSKHIHAAYCLWQNSPTLNSAGLIVVEIFCLLVWDRATFVHHTQLLLDCKHQRNLCKESSNCYECVSLGHPSVISLEILSCSKDRTQKPPVFYKKGYFKNFNYSLINEYFNVWNFCKELNKTFLKSFQNNFKDCFIARKT